MVGNAENLQTSLENDFREKGISFSQPGFYEDPAFASRKIPTKASATIAIQRMAGHYSREIAHGAEDLLSAAYMLAP